MGKIHANSITVDYGTQSNLLSDTEVRGGDALRITEVTGAPGFRFDITFTGLDPTKDYTLGFYGNYNGNVAHNVVLKIDDGSWSAVTGETQDFPSRGTMALYTFTISSAWISSAGEATIRIEHVSNGSAGHYIDIDELYMTAECIMMYGIYAPYVSGGAAYPRDYGDDGVNFLDPCTTGDKHLVLNPLPFNGGSIEITDLHMTSSYIKSTNISARYFVVYRKLKTGATHLEQVVKTADLGTYDTATTLSDEWRMIDQAITFDPKYNYYFGVLYYLAAANSEAVAWTYKSPAEMGVSGYGACIKSGSSETSVPLGFLEDQSLSKSVSYWHGMEIMFTSNEKLFLNETSPTIGSVYLKIRGLNCVPVTLFRGVTVADSSTVSFAELPYASHTAWGTAENTTTVDMGATDQITCDGNNISLPTIGGTAQAGKKMTLFQIQYTDSTSDWFYHCTELNDPGPRSHACRNGAARGQTYSTNETPVIKITETGSGNSIDAVQSGIEPDVICGDSQSLYLWSVAGGIAPNSARWGGLWAEYYGQSQYLLTTERMYVTCGMSGLKMQHQSVSQNGIADYFNHPTPGYGDLIEAKAHIRVCIMATGANDVISSSPTTETAACLLAQGIGDAYVELVDAVITAGGDALLAGPPPYSAGSATTYQKVAIRRLNQLIYNIATNYDVGFYSAYAPLATASTLSNDTATLDPEYDDGDGLHMDSAVRGVILPAMDTASENGTQTNADTWSFFTRTPSYIPYWLGADTDPHDPDNWALADDGTGGGFGYPGQYGENDGMAFSSSHTGNLTATQSLDAGIYDMTGYTGTVSYGGFDADVGNMGIDPTSPGSATINLAAGEFTSAGSFDLSSFSAVSGAVGASLIIEGGQNQTINVQAAGGIVVSGSKTGGTLDTYDVIDVAAGDEIRTTSLTVQSTGGFTGQGALGITAGNWTVDSSATMTIANYAYIDWGGLVVPTTASGVIFRCSDGVSANQEPSFTSSTYDWGSLGLEVEGDYDLIIDCASVTYFYVSGDITRSEAGTGRVKWEDASETLVIDGTESQSISLGITPGDGQAIINDLSIRNVDATVTIEERCYVGDYDIATGAAVVNEDYIVIIPETGWDAGIVQAGRILTDATEAEESQTTYGVVVGRIMP